MRVSSKTRFKGLAFGVAMALYCLIALYLKFYFTSV